MSRTSPCAHACNSAAYPRVSGLLAFYLHKRSEMLGETLQYQSPSLVCGCGCRSDATPKSKADEAERIHVSPCVRVRAIMARPRGKTHRPLDERHTASRARGPVVAASRCPSDRPSARVWGQRPGQLGGTRPVEGPKAQRGARAPGGSGRSWLGEGTCGASWWLQLALSRLRLCPRAAA